MADYVIIGGGVYGTAVAWSLAKTGADVTLLETRRVASAASGGPGRRGVRANGRDARELPLMRQAYEIWPSLHEQLDAPQFYERCGQLLLIERDEDRAEAEARVWLQNRHGIETRMLDAGMLREMEPRVSDAVTAAVHCPNDGVADHGATTMAFAAAAAARGATIIEGVAARRLVVEANRVAGVETSAGDCVTVDRGVFILANSAVRAFVAPQVALPVWNLVLQVLVTEPVETLPMRHLIGHAHRTVSLKAEAGNRVMISGGWPGVWDTVRDEGTPLQASVDGNLAEAVAVYPDLDGVAVETADASHLEAESIDGIPIIDMLPGLTNAYYATGWTGHGWAIAPVVARLLAQWAVIGRRPELLTPFSYRRFDV